MYFVVVDLNQLHTRLCNSTGNHDVVLDHWLAAQGFRASENGWIAPSDGINSLSCTEIVFSERLN
jgi:hypothetical protein